MVEVQVVEEVQAEKQVVFVVQVGMEVHMAEKGVV